MGQYNMRAKIGIVIAVVLAFGLGLALRGTVAQASAACNITGFEARVREGLSEGKSFEGSLNLQEDDDGLLSGTFTSTDGSMTAQVVGQANGHAINLALDVGNKQYLFAMGTMWNTFAQCSGPMGGAFTGPQVGDLGDWSANP
jgi:hypothetical protein